MCAVAIAQLKEVSGVKNEKRVIVQIAHEAISFELLEDKKTKRKQE